MDVFQTIFLRRRQPKACGGALCAALLVTTLLTCPAFVYAADPSPEQCTCDVPGAGQRTGAEVVNATSCLLEARYPWCDIYIATVENSQQQSVLIGDLKLVPQADDPQRLKDILGSMFDGLAAANLASNPDLATQYEGVGGALRRTVDEAFPALAECIAAFEKSSPMAAESSNAGCSVGSESGWLKIVIAIEDTLYIFLISPNG
jgi:hypothetical protein